MTPQCQINGTSINWWGIKSRDHVTVSSGWRLYQAGRVRGGASGTRDELGALHSLLGKYPLLATCWSSGSTTSRATHQANDTVSLVGILRRLQSVDNDATNRSKGRCGSRGATNHSRGQTDWLTWFTWCSNLEDSRRLLAELVDRWSKPHSVLAIRATQHMR